jgi:predicted DNA binding CopG/RHH family protein
MAKSGSKRSTPAAGRRRTTGSQRFFEPLDEQERDIRDAIENGELTPVPNEQAAKETLVRAARETLAKNRHISIRLPEKDLKRLQARAQELGIPYQTLIGSILHQYVEGKINASF